MSDNAFNPFCMGRTGEFGAVFERIIARAGFASDCLTAEREAEH